ncbi:MAG: hypothetical protein JWQ96_763 [Segetibacter sp.]|nr:hypothetical protein [Segetibacter sp.]
MGYSNWYKSLPGKKKVLVHFALQWMYWFIAWGAFKLLIPDETPITFLKLAFFATWMAVCFTLIFQWKIIRAIFKRKSGEE